MPVLRRRRRWVPDTEGAGALEYCMADGDVDGAARLMGTAGGADLPAGPGHDHSSGGLRWLEDGAGSGDHPMDRGEPALLFGAIWQAGRGRAVGRCGRSLGSTDPALTSFGRGVGCAAAGAAVSAWGRGRRAPTPTRAVRRFTVESFVTRTPALQQGIARVRPVTSMAATGHVP